MTNFLPDIIDPIDGLIGRAVHGPMHRFTFSTEGDFTGAEIERIMRQYGIRVWGREIGDVSEQAFLVKRTQAVWAEYLLCRAGVPLTCELLDPRNKQYKMRHIAGSMPTPWTKDGIGLSTVVDYVVDWLYRLTS